MAIAYKQGIAAFLALLTGLILVAVFIAPFYGALEPVIDPVVDNTVGGQSIIIEDFDYPEPDQSREEEYLAPDMSLETTPAQQFFPEQQAEITTSETTSAETGSTEGEPAEGAASLAQPADAAYHVPEDQPIIMLHRAIAVAAGRLEGNGLVISLDDIVVTEVKHQCRGDNLVQWNCGMHARTAFRAWLGGKTLSCRLPKDDNSKVEITTDCRLASEDAAQWLVRNGWVKAVEDGAYADLGKEAENAKRGIWGNKPLTFMPEFLPLPLHSVPASPAVSNVQRERPSGYFPPAPRD